MSATPQSLSLLPLQASAGFDEPLALLEACHARVERTLQTLERLADHVREHGADDAAADAARDVLRYFDIAAPLHHADEEDDLFPALRAAGARLARVLGTLHRQHGELNAAWAALRPTLQAVAARRAVALDVDAVGEFAALYRVHITLENELLLPQARQLLSAEVCSAIGARMAARRSVPWPPHAGAPGVPGAPSAAASRA